MMILRDVEVDHELWFDHANGTLFETTADGDASCRKCGYHVGDFDTTYDEVFERFVEHPCTDGRPVRIAEHEVVWPTLEEIEDGLEAWDLLPECSSDDRIYGRRVRVTIELLPHRRHPQ